MNSGLSYLITTVFAPKKLDKTMKQGGVQCTTAMRILPEFLEEGWGNVEEVSTLKTFLTSYTSVLHSGCYKRFSKMTDKTLQKFFDSLDE